MSNGTRIDPEEREPRAIKIRQPKHKGRKIVIAVLCAVLVLALGGGVFAFIEYGPDFLDFTTVFISTGTSSEPEETPDDNEPEVPEESQSEPKVPSEPEVTPELEPENEPELEPEPVVEEDPIPRDEWYMLLVNRENPLPEGFTVETAVIDGSNHAVDARIAADLSAMVAAGNEAGLDFVFYTAYRSVEKQNELFAAGKTDVPGGFGEHNSGLAVDIGNAGNADFSGSAEEAWLLEHAHEYGFILRYPEGKEDITGFKHEPWHFRYVGREQAKLIFESGLCLEEYLAQ